MFVDDEPEVLRSFKLLLRKKYRIETMSSPSEALEHIKNSEEFAIVVSDLRMPEMDGIQFLVQVRNQSPETIRIMLTGFADVDAALSAVNEGRIFRFLEKPTNKKTLIATLEAGLRQYRLITELREKNKIIKEDLKAAAFIQKSFLPSCQPNIEKLHINWKFQPSEYVGGDMFNVFHLSDEYVALYILDISGHGVASALAAISVAQHLQPQSGYLLENETGLPVPPQKVLEFLDTDFPIERFEKHFTMFYAVINIHTGLVHYSNAGHLPPFILRQGTDPIPLDKGGTLIGLGGIVPFEEGTFQLEINDRLIAFTDGIIEYESSDGEDFGHDRFLTSTLENREKSPDVMVGCIYDSMLEFGQNRPPQDDVTVLCMQYGGDSEMQEGAACSAET
nr:SpoIIE family protein phosphatase [Pseudodesulfovibrio sp. JC047]